MANKKNIKGLVFHCSDSSFGSATLIKDWHVNGNGWSDIGYTAVICNGQVENNTFMPFMDGAIEWGRDIDREAAAQRGFNDMEAVCWIGESGKFTIKQLESGRVIVKHFVNELGLEPHKIYAHSDLDKKKPYCCGLNIQEYAYACLNDEPLDEFVGLVL